MNRALAGLIACIASALVLLFAPAAWAQSCAPDPTNPENDCDRDGVTVGQGDCDDSDAQRSPNRPEVCDLKDNDCDNAVDEGFDQDGDGVTICGGDCDDTRSTVKPGAAELCDALDNDCDGRIDERNDAGDKLQRSCYSGPAGTSGVGVCKAGTQTCNATVPGTESYGTCQGEVTPSAEVCDGLDNDCDRTVDDGLTVDADRDGVRACNTCGAPAAGSCDCNDADAQVKPGLAETCDNKDNNCNGSVDENVTRVCFSGGSGTYTGTCPGPSCSPRGECRAGTQVCSAGTFGSCSGEVLPTAEVCDAKDNNCNGSVDDGLVVDADGDGSRKCGTCNAGTSCDCDDTDNQVKPGNAEVCDGKDNNCAGGIDEGIGPRVCYTGPSGTYTGTCPGPSCDPRGECQAGSQVCSSGDWGTCTGETFPATETCDRKDNDCDGQIDDGFDADRDGYVACSLCPGITPCDCNDNDANVNPGRSEVCDQKDNDCDGTIDENFDNDGDGYFACNACSFSPCDCNDSDNATYPGAPESCADCKDSDCDGSLVDEFADTDRDGVPQCAVTTTGRPAECNDSNPRQHAAWCGIAQVSETCDALDNDCDSMVDERNGATSAADKLQRSCYSGPAGTLGVGTCIGGAQVCNATVPGTASWGACQGEVVPANTPTESEKRCDGLDEDCDGTRDDGFDADGDTFVSCALCAGMPNCDCNDADSAIRPGAVEICDTVDQNCDGRPNDVPDRKCFSGMYVTPATYEGTCPGPTCDPKGVCEAGTQSCLVDGIWSACSGQVLPANDPAGAELTCNGRDDDCDGTADDGSPDADGDGFTLCENDCDDNDKNIHPGAVELCDSKDNNCDGTIDGAQTECYSGPAGTANVGVCKAGRSTCENGVPTGTCSGEVLPGTEVCNGLDDDCDGKVDEDFDMDQDGAFDCARCPSVPANTCDCNDNDAFNRPGLPERCDCHDNNCNGTVDEGDVCRAAPCYDLDGDGFTNCERDCNDNDRAIGPHRSEIVGNSVDDDCDGAVDENTDEDRDGYSTGQGDCDDRFASVHPGAAEVCDGFDNDCDGQTDEGFDKDNDKATSCAGDCDDNNASRSPYRREVCGNNIDDNCNGQVDEDRDVDGDGVSTCQGDCNDFNAQIHPAADGIPAATEVCDGQDNDCDGQTDEGFDKDGDFVATCLGDCDDNNKLVNNREYERPGNGIDDNCNGQVDEGTVDNDKDGFTPLCGDCNDFDPSINPWGTETCDRFDNNCDSLVDALPGRYDLCSTCFDADRDGVTNCDGDCNDADPRVYRGATEVCDGVDNDCEGSVDLDEQGRRLCVLAPDAGVDAGTDGGSETDGGLEMDGGSGGNPRPGPVVVGCGCGASGDGAGAAFLGLLVLALARRSTLRSATGRGGSPLLGVLLVFLALGAMGCQSSLVLPSQPDAGGTDGGDTGASDGGRDGGPVLPAGWACGDLAPHPPEVLKLPGTPFPLAVPQRFEATAVGTDGGLGYVMDDVAGEVAAFIIRRNIPSDVNPDDPWAAQTIGVREVDALSALAGTPLVSERSERFSRTFSMTTFTSSQLMRFGSATSVFALRNRLLTHFSGLSPSELGTVPQPSSAPSEAHVLNVMVRLLSGNLIVSVAVTPASRLTENQAILLDLTNGSNVGLNNSLLVPVCETRSIPSLKSDFIFVVDNSGSMLEEQQALAEAATALYAAFEQSGLDFRLGVVSSDGDVLRGRGFTQSLPEFQDAVRVGIGGNSVEMGLEFGLRAVQVARNHSDPQRRLREDAGLVLVFFSDEESTNLRPISEYISAFNTEEATCYAIVGPRPTGCQRVGLGRANAGTAYLDVAAATGGASGSICNPNLSEIVSEIVLGATGAASRSPLVYQPISASLAVRVASDLPRARSNGFDYDPAANSVLYFGQAAQQGPSAKVAYYAFINLN